MSISPENADLIARTRAELDQAITDVAGMAEQIGRLKHFAETLCVELEDACDPDGRGKRLVARLADLNAKLDALAH